MRRTGSLVAAAALLAVSTPVWASVEAAPAAQSAALASAPATQAAPVADLVAAVEQDLSAHAVDVEIDAIRGRRLVRQHDDGDRRTDEEDGECRPPGPG